MCAFFFPFVFFVFAGCAYYETSLLNCNWPSRRSLSTGPLPLLLHSRCDRNSRRPLPRAIALPVFSAGSAFSVLALARAEGEWSYSAFLAGSVDGMWRRCARGGLSPRRSSARIAVPLRLRRTCEPIRGRPRHIPLLSFLLLFSCPCFRFCQLTRVPLVAPAAACTPQCRAAQDYLARDCYAIGLKSSYDFQRLMQ